MSDAILLSPPASYQRGGETCTIEEAARRLGLSRGKAYELARRDALGVPVLRFGRKVLVATRALDRLLGVEDSSLVRASIDASNAIERGI
jgi:excisionase family DNA binding protein